jgi:pyridoxamine 5'-phosphate oxidase
MKRKISTGPSLFLIFCFFFVLLPIASYAQPNRTFQDCIKFANEQVPNKVCSFATVEGDQPRVRILSMCFADEKGFYFQTESVKAFVKQIKQNAKVELCFFDPKTATVMRASGKVEFLEDPALKGRIFNERPYLKKIVKGPEDPLFVIFRVTNGEAWFWTMADTMKEAQIPRIKF